MAQNTKPGNTERGWNDPPVFLHSTLHHDGVKAGGPPPLQGPPQKRHLLNRRVFHPGISGAPDSSCASKPSGGGGLSPNPIGPPASNNMVVLLPPASSTAVSTFPAPIIIPHMDGVPGTQDSSDVPAASTALDGGAAEVPVDDLEIPHFMDDNQLFHYTASRLRKILIHCKTVLGVRGYAEVDKKLSLFESMWEDGKLSYPVKAAMAKLAIALHSGKCELANHIHMGLMMDYIAEVGQWMVGIKRLIQEAEGPFSPVGSPITPVSLLDGDSIVDPDVSHLHATQPQSPTARDTLANTDNDSNLVEPPSDSLNVTTLKNDGS